MPIVGLTGGFGTGKTYVGSIFRKLGAKVFDADSVAHDALKKGTPTYRRIVASFGGSILDPKREIKRNVLGEIVFSNRKKLSKLNGIVHPYVIRKIKESIKKSKSGVLVIDAPLICEAGLCGLMDILVVVSASRKKQIERCVKKFRIAKKDVCKRMACQMPLKQKLQRADYRINNNGTRKETEKQVRRIWQEL